MRTTTSDEVADVSVVWHDTSDLLVEAASRSLVLGVDIETTGLDWKNDAVATVQLAVPDGPTEIVRLRESSERPLRLAKLLESPQVLKVFHHAMFDLRFMRFSWSVAAQRVACTKVASKILDPGGEIGHSLSDLVRHYLGVELDKNEQVSDWRAPHLSARQVAYAAGDVLHLPPLLYAVLSDLRQRELESLALQCFHHVPSRVELEVRGLGDVFTY